MDGDRRRKVSEFENAADTEVPVDGLEDLLAMEAVELLVRRDDRLNLALGGGPELGDVQGSERFHPDLDLVGGSCGKFVEIVEIARSVTPACGVRGLTLTSSTTGLDR